MSVSTLVSRLTGFLRIWAMAYALGATAKADAFGTANTLPNMLFELLAGGVLSGIFIPLFMERMQQDGEDSAWRFASYVFNISLIVLGTVALVATIWPAPLIRLQTATLGADTEQVRVAIWLFRFFAVQIVFYGMGLIFTGVLNSYRSFLAPAVAPIFNNVVVIVTLLGVYVPFRESNPTLAMTGLAVGTTLGVLAMMLVQLPALVKLKIRYVPRIDWHDPGLRKITAKMVPTLVYVAVNMAAVTVRGNMALATGAGGRAALDYAWVFYQLPYGIFAVALATAIFPELAERANARDMTAFKTMFGRGIRATMVLIVPLAGLLAALSTQVISLYALLKSGEFQSGDVPRVAAVLFFWALALPFFASFMFVLKSFYSLQDTRTPMYTNLVLSGVQVALYAVLTRGIGAFGGIGLIGIPITDGIFFVLHVAVLMFILRRRIGAFDGSAIASVTAKVVVASCVGAAIAWLVSQATAPLGSAGLGLLAQILLAGAVGLAAAYGTMVALKVNELTMVTGRLARLVARRRAA